MHRTSINLRNFSLHLFFWRKIHFPPAFWTLSRVMTEYVQVYGAGITFHHTCFHLLLTGEVKIHPAFWTFSRLDAHNVRMHWASIISSVLCLPLSGQKRKMMQQVVTS